MRLCGRVEELGLQFALCERSFHALLYKDLRFDIYRYAPLADNALLTIYGIICFLAQIDAGAHFVSLLTIQATFEW
jgi:hypothetical protein